VIVAGPQPDGLHLLAGLGAIIAGHARCRHHHGQIKLVAPSRPVRDLLETTRLTKLFPIYDSVEAALPEA